MGQIYFRNLHDEFFTRYPSNATDFLAISGYVGPDPLKKLLDLPLKSTVYVGLQREQQDLVLHNHLKRIHSPEVSIFYPSQLTHAKCYLWKRNSELIRGLIGSANFSVNGLNNDFREVLFEVEKRDLYSLNAYFEIIAEAAMPCTEVEIIGSKLGKVGTITPEQTDYCDLELFARGGEVPDASGLNWGFADANVTPNDAYIAIRKSNIQTSPQLFPRHTYSEGDGHRSRSVIEKVELIWDDGVIMPGLFEGSQEVDGVRFPKQIGSIPRKSDMGLYLRNRLGLPPVSPNRHPSERVTREQLVRYGRDNIRISLLQPGMYYCDFSV